MREVVENKTKLLELSLVSEDILDKFYGLIRDTFFAHQIEYDLKKDLETSLVYILTDDKCNELIGSVTLDFYFDNVATIRLLNVAKKYRKLGYGTKILKLAEEILKQRKIKRIYLRTEEKNIEFYEKNGFLSLKDDKMFVTIPNLILMQKEI